MTGRPISDPLERALAKIAINDNHCWEWTAPLDIHGYGYGRLWHKGRSRFAHRVVYELVKGAAIPDDLTIHHDCLNTRCVNPAHLRVMTAAANTALRRLCNCGSCARCRHRTYMREWSQRPENIERVRARVAARRQRLWQERKAA